MSYFVVSQPSIDTELDLLAPYSSYITSGEKSRNNVLKYSANTTI